MRLAGTKKIYRTVVPEKIRKRIFRIRKAYRETGIATAKTPLVAATNGSPLLSMILASYNVAPYIEHFLESILSQEGTLSDLELIFVDDGSTDATAEILKDWAARYPNLIVVIQQENGGAAAARNTGLDFARGKWVSFPDPDDFLDSNYLNESRKALNKVHLPPLLAVCTKLIFYYENSKEFRDGHPLNYRFEKPVTTVSTDQMNNFIHLSGATIWLRRMAIERNNFRFEGHNWGTFEDAHFINRVLLNEKNGLITFIRDAKYYYRKRSDSSSLVDTSKKKKSYYIEQLRDGTLNLALSSQEKLGHVPKYIQRTMLYEIFYHIKFMQASPDSVRSVLDTSEETECMQIIHDNFRYIDADVIENFHLAGCFEEHKVALLGLFKKMRRSVHTVYLQETDPFASRYDFFWYCGGDETYAPVVLINGKEIKLVIKHQQTKYLLGQKYFTKHGTRLELNRNDHVQFLFDGLLANLKEKSTRISAPITTQKLQSASIKPPPDQHARRADVDGARLRDLVTSAEILKKFHNCWVFMDSNHRADDNAEHLYRHLMKQSSFANKIWFILDPSSSDWPRLEKEGFQLLAYLSDEHIAAQTNAELLISSHADEYVFWPAGRALFGDLTNYKFVFLQHGVTKDDLSNWLNSKPISAFVTSSKSEYDSIASSESSYAFTHDEVVLTGFPRHDALLKKAKESKPNSLLIMPTWRKYLLEELPVTKTRDNSAWSKSNTFLESDFYLQWMAVLSDPRLMEIAKKHNLDVVFAPHQNMARYIEDFNLPDDIQIFDAHSDESYQDLFARGQMVVTDYSSVAFDMAYIERQVVYFQFDMDQLFDGSHVYQRGYFDYERDGFGPISDTAFGLLRDIEKSLSGHEDKAYAKRRRDFFAHRDGKCCDRVQASLEALT